MTGLYWGDLVLLVLVCSGVAALALLWIARTASEPAAPVENIRSVSPDGLVFLLDGTNLRDVSPDAEALIEDIIDDDGWTRIGKVLRPRFPELPRSIETFSGSGRCDYADGDHGDPARLSVEWNNGIIRLEVIEPSDASGNAIRQHVEAVQITEQSMAREAMESAPYPVWQIGDDSMPRWHNPAYDVLRNKLGISENEPVFDLGEIDRVKTGKIRTSVSVDSGKQTAWFDVFVSRAEDRSFCYAVNVDMVVNAEVARRNFVQTLTKTFAELSSGLAIFDRNRQLALFNPALIDLTALSAEFLSARPNLLSFFDRLRDNRMMPEPKDYKSWREQIADLVASARNGDYVETWTLPSGPTYKVSGRPHPDGAIAFLIEDISAEVSLTRRFRSELEQGQSLLDALDDALVVFSSTGILTLSNTAYRDLWRTDPDSSFVDMTILDAIRHFQTQCQATPLFGELRDYVLDCTERAEWDGLVRMNCGHELVCGVHPISNGATLVRFQKNSETPLIRKAQRTITAETA
ncbi:hypothetical protein SuNHUV7_13240 (plasmid) [Pseudoseohaeicola sp. NH-UV-7]|uniref:PAS-domain containing protein n=1 Tax=unclassified Sulfitobacter TaxID=196795 RepID=UPI000E0C437F|nr:PAS-domain containing protein [Sulfitobacter sp. JL08]AXI56616.1 diguanylate cyclase [Sulfitobacter sp. JL08]